MLLRSCGHSRGPTTCPSWTSTGSASRHRATTSGARYAVTSTPSLGIGAGNPLARILGTEPRAGFEIEREVPRQQLSMAGRHRFSRYRLVFELSDVADGATQLSARTYAEFPGLRGRVYRALVIGTRAHVVATKQILRSIRRTALG